MLTGMRTRVCHTMSWPSALPPLGSVHLLMMLPLPTSWRMVLPLGWNGESGRTWTSMELAERARGIVHRLTIIPQTQARRRNGCLTVSGDSHRAIVRAVGDGAELI